MTTGVLRVASALRIKRTGLVAIQFRHGDIQKIRSGLKRRNMPSALYPSSAHSTSQPMDFRVCDIIMNRLGIVDNRDLDTGYIELFLLVCHFAWFFPIL